MATRYWVGGSGNWNDTLHWSLSSNGASGASVPTSADTAIFDSSSFFANGQYVQMYNSGYGQVRNIDFSAVSFAIQPRGSLKVYGDMTLSSLLDMSDYPFFWFLGAGTMNVNTNGCVLFGEFDLGGDGVSNFSASKIVLQSNIEWDETTFEGLYVFGGTFDANGFNYKAPFFHLESTDGYNTEVDMGSGQWTIYYHFEVTEDDPINALGVATVNAGTSSLRFTSSFQSELALVLNLYHSDVYFNDVTVDNLGNNNFYFRSSVGSYFSTPSLITNWHFNSFSISRNTDNAQTANFFATFAITYYFGSFTANGFDGTTDGLLHLKGSDSIGADQFATFDISTASTSYISIQDNHATGVAAPVIPVHGVDEGNSDGWYFPVRFISVGEDITVLSENQFTPWTSIAGATINRMGWSGESVDRAESLQVTPTSDHATDRIVIHLGTTDNTPPSDNIILSIYQGGTTPENGSLLYQTSVLGSSIPGASSYETMTSVPFLLDPTTVFQSGVTYFFTITRSGSAASSYYYYSPNFSDDDPTAVRWTKDSSGTWSMNGSGWEFEFSGQFLDPLIFMQLAGVHVNSTVSVSENVSLFVPTLFFSVSDNVTVDEWMDILRGRIRDISVSQTVTATDTVSSIFAYRPTAIIDRYWVGGSGDWTDYLNHWSDTSGGSPGVLAPAGSGTTLFDSVHADNNVFFDANSFSSDGQAVNLSSNTYIRSLNCTGVNHTVSFTGAGALRTYYQTVTLNSNITLNCAGWWVNRLTAADINVNQNGATVNCPVQMGIIDNSMSVGPYILNLTADVIAPGYDITFFLGVSIGTFDALSMTVNSNNHTITGKTTNFTGGGLSGTGSGGSTIYNMGSSTINTGGFLTGGTTFFGYAVTFNGSNTTINLTPTGTPDNIFTADNWINTTHSGVSGTVSFGTINVFKGTGATGFGGYGSLPINLSGDLTVEAGSTLWFAGYDITYATTIAGTFTANGAPGNLITILGRAADVNTYLGPSHISAAVASVSYISVDHNTAIGAAAPFIDDPGGIDGGTTSGWQFPNYPSPHESITVSDVLALAHQGLPGALKQTGLTIISGQRYRLSFTMATSGFAGTLKVYQGTQLLRTLTTANTGSNTITFTADSSGTNISFLPDNSINPITIDDVSLKEYLVSPEDDDRPAKEFLKGTTDDGGEIFMRIDTQEIQLMGNPEIFANPIAIITEMERGTEVKGYIALEGDDFYELEGTIVKDVSILKVNSKDGDDVKPPMTRSIRLSWRDSSKQLSRLIQSSIVFLPTDVDTVE